MRRKGAVGPGRRVYLTLAPTQHRLLEEFATEAGRAPATLAADFLVSILDAALTDAGDVDREQVQATIRTLRGEPTYSTTTPRWRRPIDAILLDAHWWRTWYPELCALLGPARTTPATDFDLLEFLFPAIPGPRGDITWRSMDYPATAESRRRGEASRPLRPIWERVIRHVVVALTALEQAQDPSLLITVESQIRHGWLETLLSLVGEAAPGDRTSKPRLPQNRLV
jgi:hypothetical protein